MARLGYAVESGEVADRISRRRGGRLTPLDRMLLHSPPVADGWNSLLGAIRDRSTLPADVRELVILRVAALNGADYEWRAHEPVARDAGLTEAQTTALRLGGRDDELDSRQRVAVAYTDAMTNDVEVSAELFEELRAH